MANAKDEFIEFVSDKPKVLCAELKDLYYGRNKKEVWRLKVSHTAQDYKDFLEAIDFEYDDGYGSEWWDYHKTPEVPKELDPKLGGSDG